MEPYIIDVITIVTMVVALALWMLTVLVDIPNPPFMTKKKLA